MTAVQEGLFRTSTRRRRKKICLKKDGACRAGKGRNKGGTVFGGLARDGNLGTRKKRSSRDDRVSPNLLRLSRYM